MRFVQIGNHVVNLSAIAFIRVAQGEDGGKWTSALVYFASVDPNTAASLTIEFTGEDAVRLQAILSRLG